jgi:HEAT repeat protein
MEIRTEAGEVEVGTEQCFRHLIEGLRDPDPRVRRLAVCGLAAAGDTRAVEPLAAVLTDTAEDEEVRCRAAMALGKLGDDGAAPALTKAVRGPDHALHRAAILALGALGPVGIDLLAEELRCAEASDRVRAAIALGETRNLAAIEPLTARLDDEDPTVRARVREALEKIRESPVF